MAVETPSVGGKQQSDPLQSCQRGSRFLTLWQNRESIPIRKNANKRENLTGATGNKRFKM